MQAGGPRLSLGVCLFALLTLRCGARPVASANFCADFSERFGCFENYDRFCSSTQHEEWIDEKDFLTGWHLYAGHERECTATFPLILAELVLSLFALLLYIVTRLCEVCCASEEETSDTAPESSSGAEEEPRRASI